MMVANDAGYEFHVDDSRMILHIRLWGFWDVGIGEQMVAEFKQYVDNIQKLGKAWYVLADISLYPPQKPEVQPFLGQAMGYAQSHGMTKAARVNTNPITKMQISRISQKSNIQTHSFFETEEAAIKWLLE